jgi:hypothetical protein
VRLDAFPWVEYGAVEAVVSEVSPEPKAGVVRSELSISGHDSRINLAHGLTGNVEVETESVSPATLVMRTAGYWIVPQTGTASTPSTTTDTASSNSE